MSKLTHRVVWFEIPAADLDRAMRFYSTVLQTDFHLEDMGPSRMAIFNKIEQSDIGGCLVKGAHTAPSAQGTVVYLNAGDDLAAPLSRVEAAGGAVLVPKTLITPEIGYFAVLRDSEGNSVGLHSPH